MKTSTQCNAVAATLLCLALSTSAAKYHFSSSTGDDSRTATQAGTETTPWRSLAKLSGVTLAPGDQVLLKAGDIWYEGLRIQATGTSAAPILVTSFGSGALPEIRGTLKLKGALSGNIRSAVVPNKALVKAVFMDTSRIPIARYPSQTGWLWASAMKSTTGISAANLAADDWTNASIHLRAQQWAYETRRLTTGTNGNFVFDAPTRFYRDSVGYCLSNHPLAFQRSTLAKTWYHHKRDSMLHWRDAAGTDSIVDASILPTGIDLTNSDFITVRKIKVFGSAINGINVDGTGIRISNCIISNNGRNGIIALGNENHFDSNTIHRSSNRGIYSTGDNVTAIRNTVTAIGLMENLGPDGMDTVNWGGQGIALIGSNLIIRKNYVDSIGYSGIGFWGPNSDVDSNLVSNFCQTTDDGGGIYTHAGQFNLIGSAGSTIKNNVIRDSKGNTWGWRGKRLFAYHGIYLDDASHHVNIENNVVYRTSSGAFLHNSRNDTVRGNLFFANEVAQIRVQKDILVSGDPKDNSITNNILLSNGPQIDTQMVTAAVEDPANLLMAKFSQNYFCYDYTLSMECIYDGRLLWSHRRSIPLDALGAETQTNGDLEAAWPKWSFWPSTGGVLDSGANCKTGHCAKVQFTRYDQDSSNAHFSVGTYPSTTAKTSWRLALDARSAGSTTKIDAVLRSLAGDYATLGQIPDLRLPSTWTSIVGVIKSNADITKTRLDFDVRESDTTFWMDNISLRTIPDAVLDTIPSALLFIRIPSKDWQTTSYQAVSPDGRTVSVPNLGVRDWKNPNGATITALSFPVYSGALGFPVDKSSTAGPPMPRGTPIRAVWFSGKWRIYGLTEPARVFDVHGRTLATLTPTSSGEADFLSPNSVGRAWLRSAGNTISLVRIR